MNKLSISISLGYDLLILVDKKVSTSSNPKLKNRSEYIENLIRADLSKDKNFSKELKTLNK